MQHFRTKSCSTRFIFHVYSPKKSWFASVCSYFTKKLPPKYEVDENKTVVLECETSHTVSTTWYHDKKELSGMDNRELVQEGRTQRLVIKKASRKDKGTYACAVKDQTTETKLIVHGKF